MQHAETVVAASLTAKLVENWVSLDELAAKFAELEADPVRQHQQQTVLLGMHALMKPLRGGDGATLRIKFGAADDRTVRDETAGDLVNCVVLHTPSLDTDATGAHISLAQFKVAHSHGTVVVSVPARLVRIIQQSLRKEPRDWLFVDRRGRPRNRDTHSEWAADVMSRLLGKRVTTTLLRHVSATSVDWNEVETADLEKHAHEMATSTTMLLNHYRVSGAAMKRMRQ